MQWFESIDDIKNKDEVLTKINQSADVLVITSEKFKDKAKSLFKTPVIGIEDIHLIKGLQFAKVILFNVLDDEAYVRANQEPVLADLDAITIPQNRPKAGKETSTIWPTF